MKELYKRDAQNNKTYEGFITGLYKKELKYFGHLSKGRIIEKYLYV